MTVRPAGEPGALGGMRIFFPSKQPPYDFEVTSCFGPCSV